MSSFVMGFKALSRVPENIPLFKTNFPNAITNLKYSGFKANQLNNLRGGLSNSWLVPFVPNAITGA